MLQNQTPALAEVADLQRQALEDDKAGQVGPAETLYLRALTLHEEAVGSDHPDLMESLGRLAFFYGRQSRYTDIEPLILRGLTLLTAKPGPKHKGILQTLDALASQARRRGHLDDAERYCRQVIAARQRLLGLDHPRVAKNLKRLDDILEVKNNPQAEAERIAKESANVARVWAKIRDERPDRVQ